MFLERGYVFTHEAVRDWEARFAPLFTERLRIKRQGKAGKRWYVDKTYVQAPGRTCYLYRAIDRDGIWWIRYSASHWIWRQPSGSSPVRCRWSDNGHCQVNPTRAL
jgi:DDE superfamily endonuclease